ncbi:MAG: hypothetical protein JXR48_06545 [Candidatus Delongbacteria bacterium]|nr:hypothetical protein [Candidatus Delongbacteria bacterium]MBN2834610.1 hypothetical protein [Candidatus Delongbacteria bacterium]
MKKQDILFIAIFAIIFLPFILSADAYQFYIDMTKNHSFVMSFIKFAVLATLGEILALRIVSKIYIKKGFGIIPRAIVWGFLGIMINCAFIIFANGSPKIAVAIGFEEAPKLLTSFLISATMNTIFAPVMMTLHKITDTHILTNGGTLSGFFTPIKFGKIIAEMNWSVMWNFVFKKTIPFFWIPAHTITFMLPKEFQILFAAVLGIALGVIMAIASILSNKK